MYKEKKSKCSNLYYDFRKLKRLHGSSSHKEII